MCSRLTLGHRRRCCRYRRIDKRILPSSVVPVEVRNSKFNRHMDILPNPSTAVSMPLVNGDVTTGYVNANFVQGWDEEPGAFIAAMGPLPSSLVPFWRMIWKNNITTLNKSGSPFQNTLPSYFRIGFRCMFDVLGLCNLSKNHFKHTSSSHHHDADTSVIVRVFC